MMQDKEYIKEVTISCKSKTERQYNGREKKYKTTNNDLQITTQKPKIGEEETVMNSSSGAPEG